MHTSTVKDPVLADRDAELVAAFEMLCERMGKLVNMAEHWLRRKSNNEWEQDGKVDRHLLALDRDVELWRGGLFRARPMKVMWSAVKSQCRMDGRRQM